MIEMSNINGLQATSRTLPRCRRSEGLRSLGEFRGGREGLEALRVLHVGTPLGFPTKRHFLYATHVIASLSDLIAPTSYSFMKDSYWAIRAAEGLRSQPGAK